MKKILRKNAPPTFFSTKNKINYYQNLRTSNGEIKHRWNLGSVRHELRTTLLEMSKNECSYCGKKISMNDMNIDHFLPKSQFPYLSYYFENYLPTCNHCNQSLKKNFYPKSLEKYNTMLGEKILEDVIHGIIPYNRDEVLNNCKDRIVEPSFDTIESHLEFDPLSVLYATKTETGKNTNDIFFNHNEVVHFLQAISNQVQKLIREGVSKETILETSVISGYSFYFEVFYDFWIEMIP